MPMILSSIAGSLRESLHVLAAVKQRMKRCKLEIKQAREVEHCLLQAEPEEPPAIQTQVCEIRFFGFHLSTPMGERVAWHMAFRIYASHQ